MRFLRRDHLPRQRHLHREPLSDEPRQTLRTTIPRDDPELHFGLTKLCIFACQTNRAGHRDLAPTAKRETVDTRDHWLSQILNQIEDRLATMRVFLPRHSVVLGEFDDVRAGDESLLPCHPAITSSFKHGGEANRRSLNSSNMTRVM